MGKRYHNIVTDEVLYWFDVLQDKSIKSISEASGIDKNKVRKILDLKYS